MEKNRGNSFSGPLRTSPVLNPQRVKKLHLENHFLAACNAGGGGPYTQKLGQRKHRRDLAWNLALENPTTH